MIASLNRWTQNIIIAVIISIIIEMILPDGSNKKYVKVVSSLYILYIIVNPILGIKDKANFNEIKAILKDNSAMPTVSEADIANTYILSLQNALQSEIVDLGYNVDSVQIYITSDYSDIVKIEIKMKSGENYDKEKILELVQSNYEIDIKNIIFL